MTDPMPDSTTDFLKGTLDLMVLKTLSWAPAHGYGIARWIEDVTGGVLEVEEGSLYPALRRLEDRGVVESRWGLSENNRRARFYAITRAGRQHLHADASTWMRFARAVMCALEAEPSVV